MKSPITAQLTSLGPLRLGLISLAMINTFLPVTHWLFNSNGESLDTSPTWEVLSTIVGPVMAPILMVVVFLDYLMARVRAGDENEELAVKTRFNAIARLELTVLIIMLIFWVPFFYSLGR